MCVCVCLFKGKISIYPMIYSHYCTADQATVPISTSLLSSTLLYIYAPDGRSCQYPVLPKPCCTRMRQIKRQENKRDSLLQCGSGLTCHYTLKSDRSSGKEIGLKRKEVPLLEEGNTGCHTVTDVTPGFQ